MDFSTLLNDIANDSQDDDGDRSPPPPRPQRLCDPAPSAAEPAAPDAAARPKSLDELTSLDDRAWATIVNALDPDDVVVGVASLSKAIGLRLLAPMDDRSRDWVLTNAAQLGEPTHALRDATRARILDVAARLIAEGAFASPPAETTTDRTPAEPAPHPASAADQATPDASASQARPADPAGDHRGSPAPDTPTPDIGFGASQDGKTVSGTIGAPTRSAPPNQPSSGQAHDSNGNPDDERIRTRITIAPTGPEPTTAPSPAASSDHAGLIAVFRALLAFDDASRAATIADQVDDPFLATALRLLAHPISRNDLDATLLDLQAQAERAFSAHCDLIRDGITALHAGEPADQFQQRHEGE